jgi:hypothetical protein
MKTSNIVLRVGLFLIVLTTTGCLPGITWLPDSSGFVYTTENRALVHFDVAKGQARTLVEDTDTATLWPAVSPDGKQVAVARLTHEKDKPDMLQVIIYDMNGKVIQRSGSFIYSEAGASEPKDKLGLTVLFWGPQDNQMVISSYTSTAKSAIYNIKTNSFSIMPEAMPAAFGGSPVRPDRQGFLVAKVSEKKKDLTGMSFIDTKGKEHAIVLKLEALSSQEKQQTDMLVFPFLFTSHWDGNKAVVFNAKWRFEIDTDRLVGKLMSTPVVQINKGKEIRQQFTFPGIFKVIRVWTSKKEQAEKSDHLEIFDSKDETTKVLIEKATNCTAFPSPNRKLVAVRCREAETKEGKQSDLILVINQQGQVIGQIAKDK